MSDSTTSKEISNLVKMTRFNQGLEGDSLVYTVPKGALLYLKNHSGGVDERIFDYHNGVQRYW